jgi:hypothetical protein
MRLPWFHTRHRLALVADNDAPSASAIERARRLGAEIIKSVHDREDVIASNDRIDRNFALPTANWDTATSDYIEAYRLLATLRWEEIRLLRLRAQAFSGNSLVAMGIAQGLHSADPIPPDFEQTWGLKKELEVARRWKDLTSKTRRGLVLDVPNILGETGWWIGGKLVNVDVIDYQERLYLLDCAGLIDRVVDGNARILEIGGGYGAMALALAGVLRPSQYVICDLPESLLFSGLYLSMAQRKPVRIVPRDGNIRAEREGEICLLPNYLAQVAFPGEHFDIVINTLSMSEMSPHQVSTYGTMISKLIGTSGVFFEQNHDNRHVGLIDCSEYLAPAFQNMRKANPGAMITTRGAARLWSN